MVFAGSTGCLLIQVAAWKVAALGSLGYRDYLLPGGLGIMSKEYWKFGDDWYDAKSPNRTAEKFACGLITEGVLGLSVKVCVVSPVELEIATLAAISNCI